ncbi:transcription cofactor vestigial-like protein 1 [Aulostomus maculatus]
MEDRTDNPIAVKVEGHSQCVILTYFQGDIGSMVDAHFTRALSSVCKAKAGPTMKTKRMRKTIKLEENIPCQGIAAESYSESQVPPLGGHCLTFSPADNPPGPWHSFIARTGESPALPSSAYSLSQEGLSVTGQQYATSLLNLLHSDRSEMGHNMASSSKPELLPNWTVPPVFRDSVDFEPGQRADKKDLYWY